MNENEVMVLCTQYARGLRMVVHQIVDNSTLFEYLVLPSWARNNDRDLALEAGIEWTAAAAQKQGEYWLDYFDHMQENIRQSRI